VTADPEAEAARRRAAHRRRLQQRQTVIFGVLITLLVAVALVAGAMWTGVLPSPVARPFSTPEATDAAEAVPCPPPDAMPVPFGEIAVNVYNGTRRAGLAATTGSQLAQFGVVVSSQANYPGGSYGGVAQVVAGPLGIPSAYTISALIPESVVTYEGSRSDATVDVVLGEAFESVLSPDASPVNPSIPLEAPAGCTPVTPPTADDAEAPAAEG
jgi:hypothetical protein